jgi:hypothetical protein
METLSEAQVASSPVWAWVPSWYLLRFQRAVSDWGWRRKRSAGSYHSGRIVRVISCFVVALVGTCNAVVLFRGRVAWLSW